MVSSSDVLAILPQLAEKRPIFHSEADFQHALAWEAQASHPQSRVRLETRPAPGVHLDILISDHGTGESLAIELKYLTDRWSGEVNGESFDLLRQGAQDIRGYDCVKDIARIEQMIANGYAESGLVLVLTNDPSYWQPPGHTRQTNADAFRLRDGLTLRGSRAWGPNTGAGTMGTGRITPIVLSGSYPLWWHSYSSLQGSRGRFRYLPVEVGAIESP